MKQYKVYLFDFDGTLFDTLPSSVFVFKEAFRRKGVELKDEEILNFTRVPIPDTYKRSTETDIATDAVIYGGIASGASIYLDNIHPVTTPLTANGFECGGLLTNSTNPFMFYSPGHSSTGIDNYVAPQQYVFTNASAGIVTSYGFDYEHKTEGLRSFTFTKTSGYVGLYLGSSIYSQLGENDYVSIDIYSDVAVNANQTTNFLDGFTNTTVETKKANEWQTYNFFKGNNMTSDGRFLIIQGSSAGKYCFDNIQIHRSEETPETYETSDTYINSSDTYVDFKTRKQPQTVVKVTVDGTALVPVNNTRYVYIDSKAIAIKKEQLGLGEHAVTVKYLSDGLLYTETKYMLSVKETATMLGVSIHTVYKLIEKGVLEAKQISERRTMITAEEIDKYISSK